VGQERASLPVRLNYRVQAIVVVEDHLHGRVNVNPVILSAITAAVTVVVTLVVTKVWNGLGTAGSRLLRRIGVARRDDAEGDVDVLPMADRLAERVILLEGAGRWQGRGGDWKSIDLEFCHQSFGSRDADGAADTGRLTRISNYFTQLGTRRIAITGAAGSGKTALAIELIVQLLKDRSSGAPVPVRIPLTGWDPASVKFEDWVASALGTRYLQSAQIAGELVRRRLIVPVLDGLDDLHLDPGDTGWTEAFDELNNFAVADGTARASLVLTSRVSPDPKTGIPWLRDAATVLVQPVTTAKAIQYLRGRVNDPERWVPVIQILERDPGNPLSRAMSTPLWLTFAASSADPAKLSDRSDIDDYLLGRFVDSSAKEAADGTPYRPSEVRAWLSRLAQYLSRATGHPPATDIVLSELWAIGGSRRVRFTHLAVSAGIAAAATIMLARVLIGTPSTWWQTAHWIFNPSASFTAFGRAGRIGAVLMFLIVPVTATVQSLRATVRPNSFRGVRFRPGLLVVAVAASGAALWTMTTAILGHKYVLSQAGATFFPVLMAAFLLMAVFFALKSVSAEASTPTASGDRPTPTAVLRSDVIAGVASGAVLGALAGAFGAFAHQLSVQPLQNDRIGLTSALLIAFACGFLLGYVAISVTSTRYAVMVIIDSGLGRSPLRLAKFLNRAENAGLLRLAGSAYQFRHQRLQEYLAQNPEPRPRESRHRRAAVVLGLPLAPAAIAAAAMVAAIILHGGVEGYLSGPPRPPCRSGTVCNPAGTSAPLVSGGRVIAHLSAGTGLYIKCYRREGRVSDFGERSDIWVWVNWTSETTWTWRGYIPLIYVYSKPSVVSYYHECSPSDYQS
jgi:hypothetical protein